MIDFLKKELANWSDCSLVLRAERVHGGDINEAFKIQTPNQILFVKVQSHNIPDLFEKEAKGLEILRGSKFVVPEVRFFNKKILVLDWVEKSSESATFFEAAGKALAQMHKITRERFGLDHNNYIGSLQQINDETNSWAEFYMANRIEVQVKMAVDKGVWGAEMVRKSNRLYVELENIIPRENPALLHGDLWSGNIMATENDAPVIYDPAVYFGHREMDLAMTKLFGGFTPNFYEAYTAEYSLEPCFETRAQIHQLYPILVHVNLFGGGYKAQAESIISQYI